MIRGEDWVRGELLNLNEARRIVTGKFAGHVEHKYDYAARLAETPAYGWASLKHGVGLWVVNPSLEYINGGPIKVELTPREQQVLEKVAEGLMNKEIAKQLQTSVRNVEKYVTRLLNKTGTSSRTELVRYALTYGLIRL